MHAYAVAVCWLALCGIAHSVASRRALMSDFTSLHHQKQLSLPTFTELAVVSGSDKVVKHSYHHVYERYLPHMRHQPINLLEIGLGCMNVPYGASLPLWRKYFTHAKSKVHFIEFDPACRNMFAQGAHNVYGTIFLGDQSNVTFLNEVITAVGGDGSLDVIIDDGSHHPGHQQVSFRTLWRALKSGGVYVIEDLEGRMTDGAGQFVLELVKERWQNKSSDILSVDVQIESVAVSKMAAADQWLHKR